MISNLQTIYPISPVLQQYIYCYYIIEHTGADFKNSHYSFPHTLNALSIYSNGDFFNEGHRIKTVGNNTGYQPFCVLQGKCLHPLLVDMEGALSRITILFKPLGLNNFVKPLLCEIMHTEPTLFTQWESEKFEDALRYLFMDTKDIKSRISSFEDFLLSVYEPVNLPTLVNALKYLSDFDNEKSIETIA